MLGSFLNALRTEVTIRTAAEMEALYAPTAAEQVAQGFADAETAMYDMRDSLFGILEWLCSVDANGYDYLNDPQSLKPRLHRMGVEAVARANEGRGRLHAYMSATNSYVQHDPRTVSDIEQIYQDCMAAWDRRAAAQAGSAQASLTMTRERGTGAGYVREELRITHAPAAPSVVPRDVPRDVPRATPAPVQAYRPFPGFVQPPPTRQPVQSQWTPNHPWRAPPL